MRMRDSTRRKGGQGGKTIRGTWLRHTEAPAWRRLAFFLLDLLSSLWIVFSGFRPVCPGAENEVLREQSQTGTCCKLFLRSYLGRSTGPWTPANEPRFGGTFLLPGMRIPDSTRR